MDALKTLSSRVNIFQMLPLEKGLHHICDVNEIQIRLLFEVKGTASFSRHIYLNLISIGLFGTGVALLPKEEAVVEPILSKQWSLLL